MKIYDELTNEELTSPDLSAGYLYTARRVAEHVPESREVMQGTVTEDDPKGLEHIISGYDVYEDCHLYHRYTVAELAERQQVDFDTYQALHTGALEAPLIPGKAIRFVATGDTPTTVGLRRYAVQG